MNKPVTEEDLRLPEFKGVPISELEFDGTGKNVVRKDRWERAVRDIADAVGANLRNFEIQAVVNTVCEKFSFYPLEDAASNKDFPLTGEVPAYSLLLTDGSILNGACLIEVQGDFKWRWSMSGTEVYIDYLDTSLVEGWKLVQ